MSLKLHSTFDEIDRRLRSLDRDDNVNPVEFKEVRDGADQFLALVPDLDASAFQKAADHLVEETQKLALAARKAKLSPMDRQRLQQASEYQLGYVIAGYQSSLQRL